MRKRKRQPICRKIILKLPDLDHAKSSVLNSLSSPHSRRNYKFAMEQFITWYCSEPRLSLNRAVVLRFRLYLESLGLAPGTVNQRLAAVRRLAYEAADSGLLSPELAAGIRRVKGAKQLGVRAGNWLTQNQAHLLLEKAAGEDLRSLRDLAMVSVLVGCGLRRAELSSLRVEDVQIRQGHWAIVDLVGKGGHIRTVPMPLWVKEAVDRWREAAKVAGGRIFRAVSRHGKTKTGRLWTYVRDDRPAGSSAAPAVWFAYSPDRKGEHPQQHLSKFTGILQADGYAGFNQIYESGRVQEAACWAHVRRKFYDLKEAHKSPIAAEAVERIAPLYGIEEEIRGRAPDERRAVRDARSRPLLAAMHEWLEASLAKLSKKSDTSAAIRYALARWDALMRFCDDGRIEIDNNSAERALRAVAMRRSLCPSF
jgi:site-specific recombinase XerC